MYYIFILNIPNISNIYIILYILSISIIVYIYKQGGGELRTWNFLEY